MARRQSAATRAAISRTKRIREGKLHNTVLESTLPKNPAGSKVRGAKSAGTTGRISLSDLPMESRRNILFGARKRTDKHSRAADRAQDRLVAAKADHKAKPSVATRNRVAAATRENSRAHDKYVTSASHESRVQESLHVRTPNPAGTKPLKRQAAPAVKGKVTEKPAGLNMAGNPYAMSPGQQAAYDAKAKRENAARARRVKKVLDASKLAGGGQSAGLGVKPKSSVGTHVPSPAQTSVRPKRVLSDAQKAAKAERARRRRAAKKG